MLSSRRAVGTLLAVLSLLIARLGRAQDELAPTPEESAPSEPAAPVAAPDPPELAPPEPAPSTPVTAPPAGAFPLDSPPPPTTPAPTPTPALRLREPPAASPAPQRAAFTPVSEPASSSVSAPVALEAGESESEGRDSDGLFGPFRLGPVVGVGLPNLLSFGGTVKLTRFLGGGVNFGLIPTMRVSYYGDATLAYKEVDVYGRLYPFGGSFFLGAGVGYATVNGAMDSTFDATEYAAQLALLGLSSTVHYQSEASVRTMVLTPQIGFFTTFASGFSAGIDVGAQVPIAPSEIEFSSRVNSQLPPALVEQYLAPNDQKVRDTLEKLGRTPIPTINLRIGWLL